MAKMGFDSSTVAPATFDLVPKGWYAAKIADAENKTGAKGERLSLEVQLTRGTYKGRKAFDGLNWKHENADAQRIGQEQLSALCHAVGIRVLEEDKQLIGKELAVKIGIEDERKEGDKTYDARNVIKGWKPLSELSESDLANAEAPKAGGTPMGANAPADAPDWMKNAETSGPAPDVPPALPDAPPPPPVVKTDEERLAEAGWTQHPSSPPHWYKGQEVLLKADALGKLESATPTAPPVAQASAASTASAGAANTATAATSPAASAPAAAGDTPPWLQG